MHVVTRVVTLSIFFARCLRHQVEIEHGAVVNNLTSNASVFSGRHVGNAAATVSVCARLFWVLVYNSMRVLYLNAGQYLAIILRNGFEPMISVLVVHAKRVFRPSVFSELDSITASGTNVKTSSSIQ